MTPESQMDASPALVNEHASSGVLVGKTALVTGASRGIGAAIAQLFVEHGARVIAVDIDSADVPIPGVRYARLDVSNSAAWRQLFRDLPELADLTILVNNAGIGAVGGVLTSTRDDWDRVLGVNQNGPLYGMRICIPTLIANGGGSIVNLSSVLGSSAMPFSPAYHASKTALRQMTKNAAVTYALDGIRVNAVLPGWIDTELTRTQNPDHNRAFLSKTPMGRGADPLEVANAVLFLCSDAASFITGIDLPVDGGFLAH